MLWGVVIIFFSLVALLFLLTRGQRIEEHRQVYEPSPSSSPSSIEPAHEDQPGPAMHVQQDASNHTSVRYANGSFTPPEIMITTETGCFVEIQNKSNRNLVPRLGPYDSHKEQGFLYPPVAPGTHSLIDPRYGTVTTFSFYDKNNSGATFIVHIDPTCLY